MLWAAASLCFFGFFRSGELTVQTINSFDPARHLSWGDVTIDDMSSPSVIRVFLKQSKCDQLARGAEVFVGRTNTSICPVAAILAYIVSRGTNEGPFFRLSNGNPLTKHVFITRVRQALDALGLPQQLFAGHSFRVGAATAAAKAGIEDSTIQMLGRWNSAAFLCYIRTPKDQLARYSQQIAQ